MAKSFTTPVQIETALVYLQNWAKTLYGYTLTIAQLRLIGKRAGWESTESTLISPELIKAAQVILIQNAEQLRLRCCDECATEPRRQLLRREAAQELRAWAENEYGRNLTNFQLVNIILAVEWPSGIIVDEQALNQAKEYIITNEDELDTLDDITYTESQARNLLDEYTQITFGSSPTLPGPDTWEELLTCADLARLKQTQGELTLNQKNLQDLLACLIELPKKDSDQPIGALPTVPADEYSTVPPIVGGGGGPQPPPPNQLVPNFTFTPEEPAITDAITFDASATRLNNNPCPSCSYTWILGDGTTAYGRVITHRYAVASQYLVTLLVTFNGVEASTAQRVVVSREPLQGQVEPTYQFTPPAPENSTTPPTTITPPGGDGGGGGGGPAPPPSNSGCGARDTTNVFKIQSILNDAELVLTSPWNSADETTTQISSFRLSPMGDIFGNFTYDDNYPLGSSGLTLGDMLLNFESPVFEVPKVNAAMLKFGLNSALTGQDAECGTPDRNIPLGEASSAINAVLGQRTWDFTQEDEGGRFVEALVCHLGGRWGLWKKTTGKNYRGHSIELIVYKSPTPLYNGKYYQMVDCVASLGAAEAQPGASPTCAPLDDPNGNWYQGGGCGDDNNGDDNNGDDNNGGNGRDRGDRGGRSGRG